MTTKNSVNDDDDEDNKYYSNLQDDNYDKAPPGLAFLSQPRNV